MKSFKKIDDEAQRFAETLVLPIAESLRHKVGMTGVSEFEGYELDITLMIIKKEDENL